MKKITVAFFCFILLAFAFACKDEEDCTKTQSQVSAKEAAMEDAFDVYFQSPVEANCLAYKTAIDEFIAVVEPLVACEEISEANRTTYQTKLTSAQSNRATLSC